MKDEIWKTKDEGWGVLITDKQTFVIVESFSKISQKADSVSTDWDKPNEAPPYIVPICNSLTLVQDLLLNHQSKFSEGKVLDSLDCGD